MTNKVTTGGMRQMLLSVQMTGVAFKKSDLAIENAPYEVDLSNALKNLWVEEVGPDRYKLTKAGEAYLARLRPHA